MPGVCARFLPKWFLARCVLFLRGPSRRIYHASHPTNELVRLRVQVSERTNLVDNENMNQTNPFAWRRTTFVKDDTSNECQCPAGKGLVANGDGADDDVCESCADSSYKASSGNVGCTR